MIEYDVIVAMDDARGIGIGGKLPWHIPADLKYFKKVTTQTRNPLKQNAVIMGRKTWESIPVQLRPLPARINIVLSTNPELDVPLGTHRVSGLTQGLSLIEGGPLKERVERVFVIGGEKVFRSVLSDPRCRSVYVTHIRGKFSCDTFFPAFENHFRQIQSSSIQSEGPYQFNFIQYQRIEK
jgi:dihydrofolate reductase/thymidylate synthase